jgi:hypothetical protein
MLMSHGLGRLEDGTGLLSQLGFLVQDHEHFRSLLVRCEPENRSAMYNSLTPYLRFAAKPLDVYIAESKERAANQNLPTIDEKGNINFNSKPTPTIDQEVAAIAPDLDQDTTAIVQRIVGDAVAKWTLEVTCRKCTKFATFTGIRKADAVDAARDAGWAYDSWRDGSEICPDCLG